MLMPETVMVLEVTTLDTTTSVWAVKLKESGVVSGMGVKLADTVQAAVMAPVV